MYKVGSRKSLLAEAQFTLLKKMYPNLKLNYVPITSRGDIKKDKIPGLYTSTLDLALKNHQIDLALHCLKDVPLKRPSFLKEVLRIERDFPHDILLIRKQSLSKKKLFLGTHSERRKKQMTSLKKILPKNFQAKTFLFKHLEGNLKTRLELLQDGSYDSLVLSLQGLERFCLANTSLGKKLLKNLTFIVLPLTYFPTSPGQGDLTLEAHKKNTFKKVFSQKKFFLTDLERKDLKKLNGGCSSPIGITYLQIRDYLVKFFFYKKNFSPIFTRIQPLKKTKVKKAFIGLKNDLSPWIKDDQYIFTPLKNTLKKKGLIYFTSKYSFFKTQNCVVSGLQTWKEASQKNIWVYASHEGLGEDFFKSLKKLICLQTILPSWKKPWIVSTHEKGKSSLGDIHTTYKAVFHKKFLDSEISHFYWTSAEQYRQYLQHYPWIKNRFHFCGLGKTYDELKKILNIQALSGVEEFKKLYVPTS